MTLRACIAAVFCLASIACTPGPEADAAAPDRITIHRVGGSNLAPRFGAYRLTDAASGRCYLIVYMAAGHGGGPAMAETPCVEAPQ